MAFTFGASTVLLHPLARPTFRSAFIAGNLLVALPWLWPVLAGPLPAMLPDLAAWACGALLLVLCASQRFELRFDVLLAGGLVLAAVTSAVIGLLQYLDLEDGVGLWIAIAKPGEAYGNIQQRNLFATLMAVGLVALNHLCRLKEVRRRLGLFVSTLLISALAATTSRTGLAHVILLLMLSLIWRTGTRQAIFLTVAYSLAIFVMPWILKSFTGLSGANDLMARLGADYACASRMLIWENMLRLIAQKPLSGWGAGELLYAHYITDFHGSRACIKLSHAHNIVLHWAFIWGIPVASLLVAGIAYLVACLRPWAVREPAQQMGWALLALLGFHSMVEFPLWLGWFQIVALCAMVLVVRVPFKGYDFGNLELAFIAKARFWSMTGFAALIITVCVAVDYFKVSQLYLPIALRPAYYKVDTLNRVKDTWLFRSHVLIAQVVTTPVTPDNAGLMLFAAQEALHIAPDSRIIRQLLVAAAQLNRRDLLELHSHRYAQAWPLEYREWLRIHPEFVRGIK